MKLTELREASDNAKAIRTKRAEAQAQNKKRAEKASDLSGVLDQVKKATDLDSKKAAARKLALAFTAGGKDKFLKSVDNCKTPGDVDRLAYNAALKGEGHGTKMY
jgi:hypothetical protein